MLARPKALYLGDLLRQFKSVEALEAHHHYHPRSPRLVNIFKGLIEEIIHCV